MFAVHEVGGRNGGGVQSGTKVTVTALPPFDTNG